MTDKAGGCLKLLSVKWDKKATQMTDKSLRCLKGDVLLPSKGGKNGVRTHSRSNIHIHLHLFTVSICFCEYFLDLLFKSVQFYFGYFFQALELSGQYQSLTVRKTDWKHREEECHVDRLATAVCLTRPVQTPRRKQRWPHVNLLHQVATCTTLDLKPLVRCNQVVN